MATRFGDFVLDLSTRELRRGEQPVRLSPKALQLLAELVACRPRALSKSELQQRLWPGVFVSEANVANLVGEIRDAIGDEPRAPRFVRTVPRFGYAFCGEAHEENGAATSERASGWRLIWSKGRTLLSRGEHVLGRSRAVDVSLDAPSVSRRHARLRVTVDEVTVEDLGSKNGTFLGRERLAAPRVLHDGDEFRVGGVRLKLRRVHPDGSTETHSGTSTARSDEPRREGRLT